MAYQFLLVVAGVAGSIVSGNPFKGLRSVLVLVLFKLLFWAESSSLLCLVFDQLGIKQNNRQRIFNSRGCLTYKTHAGRGFQ